MADNHLKKLCICTKFHAYSLNGFWGVKHKSTSLMVLKNDTVDTIFKLKTSTGIILLKFTCSYDSCSLYPCRFSDHALNLYQVSRKYLERSPSSGVNTISKLKIQRGIIPQNCRWSNGSYSLHTI